MVDLLMVAFVMGTLVLLFFGVLGLVNPKWTGVKSRSRSSLVYFGSSVICFFIAVGIESNGDTNTSEGSNKDERTSRNSAPSANTKSIDYSSLKHVISEFSGLTDIQKERWRDENDWKHWVKGTCTVSEVSETNWTSEIPETDFEVTCELSDDNRVVLFYDKSDKKEVLKLNKGNNIDFQGRLKTIREWGFWSSGYVKVTSDRYKRSNYEESWWNNWAYSWYFRDIRCNNNPFRRRNRRRS